MNRDSNFERPFCVWIALLHARAVLGLTPHQPLPRPCAAPQARVHGFASLAVTAFDHMEEHIKPVVRRYLPLPVQRKIMGDCWDAGAPEGWFRALPAVVQALPTLAQRATYVRAFVWAMPERAQQIGVMVALGVDPGGLLREGGATATFVLFARLDAWGRGRGCMRRALADGVLGAMRGCAVTWYRLRRVVPEIVPRGEEGWKRY
jgi:hypothetical protein